MRVNELHQRLLRAARQAPPSTEVPWGFVPRVMARLKVPAARDEWAHWVRAWWWGATACAAIAVLASAWSFYGPTEGELAVTFSQEFEQTILAATADEAEVGW